MIEDPQPIVTDPSDPALNREPIEPMFTRRPWWDVATTLVLIACAVALFFIVPAARNSSDNTEAIIQGDDLTACRAEQRLSLIDTTFLAVSVAQADVSLLILDGLVALTSDDPAALDAAVAEAEGARDTLADARVAQAEGIAAYADVVQASIVDPAAFVANCKENRP
jgi:hypothetical protein